MLHLFYSSPDYAQYYQPELLDLSDSKRVNADSRLHENQRWQNSRALKQAMRTKLCAPRYSLSHKHQYALIAAIENSDFAHYHAALPILEHSAHHLGIGVDLEQSAPRDWRKLAQRICSPTEQRFLQHSATPLIDFYKLWTLKEALIKAEQAAFPTQMKELGLCAYQPHWQLATHSNQPYLFLSASLESDNHSWQISALWQIPPQPIQLTLHSNCPVTLTIDHSNADLILKYCWIDSVSSRF